MAKIEYRSGVQTQKPKTVQKPILDPNVGPPAFAMLQA